jgi:ADP-heptose:LPS heptosyltransferase
VQTITLIEKVKFKISQNLELFLPLMNTFGLQLTILNAFPGIGDVLLLTSLVESIKKKYPNIKINVITNHCGLLKNNVSISKINQKTTFFTFRHWYLEIRQNKNPKKHILTESLEKLGLSSQIQNPSYFVTIEERKNAVQILRTYNDKPLLAINTVSKEPTKNWLPQHWNKLIVKLAENFTLIQLGDENEITFDNTVRLAGKLNLRESISVLEKCSLFIGGVSFLMHAAAAVGLKSVIIYGGRETPSNSGYKQNANLFENMNCGPCWIHQEDGEVCDNNHQCMQKINPELVYSTIINLLAKRA